MFPTPRKTAFEAAAIATGDFALHRSAWDSGTGVRFDESRDDYEGNSSWRVVYEASVYVREGWEAEGILFTIWTDDDSGTRAVALYPFSHCSCNGTSSELDGMLPKYVFSYWQFVKMTDRLLDPRLVGLGGDKAPVLEETHLKTDEAFAYHLVYTHFKTHHYPQWKPWKD